MSRHHRLGRCAVRGEMSINGVKQVSFLVALNVWGNTQETGKFEEKYQMEIGELLLGNIEPPQRVLYI